MANRDICEEYEITCRCAPGETAQALAGAMGMIAKAMESTRIEISSVEIPQIEFRAAAVPEQQKIEANRVPSRLLTQKGSNHVRPHA